MEEAIELQRDLTENINLNALEAGRHGMMHEDWAECLGDEYCYSVNTFIHNDSRIIDINYTQQPEDTGY